MPLAAKHHTVTLILEPTGEGCVAPVPALSDCAKVVKNSLSLSAVLAAVVAGVVGTLGVAVAAGTGCKKPMTLLKAASRRVTPRLGAGDTGSLPLAGRAGVVDVAGAAAV